MSLFISGLPSRVVRIIPLVLLLLLVASLGSAAGITSLTLLRLVTLIAFLLTSAILLVCHDHLLLSLTGLDQKRWKSLPTLIQANFMNSSDTLPLTRELLIV